MDYEERNIYGNAIFGFPSRFVLELMGDFVIPKRIALSTGWSNFLLSLHSCRNAKDLVLQIYPFPVLYRYTESPRKPVILLEIVSPFWYMVLSKISSTINKYSEQLLQCTLFLNRSLSPRNSSWIESRKMIKSFSLYSLSYKHEKVLLLKLDLTRRITIHKARCNTRCDSRKENYIFKIYRLHYRNKKSMDV